MDPKGCASQYIDFGLLKSKFKPQYSIVISNDPLSLAPYPPPKILLHWKKKMVTNQEYRMYTFSYLLYGLWYSCTNINIFSFADKQKLEEENVFFQNQIEICC